MNEIYNTFPERWGAGVETQKNVTDRDKHREGDRGRDIPKNINRDRKTERETETKSLALSIQGGEDAEDALSRRSFVAKEPLIVGLFCGK